MRARNKVQELMETIDTVIGAAVPEPTYGPSMSSGTVYTDKATITAVQKKLKALGFFPYTVDGKYGKDINAAIYNYTATYGPAKNGPPDDELLAKLGLSKSISFSDEEADSMTVQVRQASTPAQVQVVAAKIENLAANASPDVRAEATAAREAAAKATTPAEVADAKNKVQKAIEKVQGKTGFFSTNVPGINRPLWQVGLGTVGVLALGYGVYRLASNRPMRGYSR